MRKLSLIEALKLIQEDEGEIKPNPVVPVKKSINQEFKISTNISQYWKNTEILEKDLTIFLRKLKSSDYKLYQMAVTALNRVMNHNVISKEVDPVAQPQQ
jgi:hypothetical protein